MNRHTHYKKIFQNPALLNEMLKDRRNGMSYRELGRKYNCDHSSCVHWCMKMGLPKIQAGRKTLEETKYEPICITRGMETKFENVEQNFTNEKLNDGKSYAEYLAHEKNKRYNQLLSKK